MHSVYVTSNPRRAANASLRNVDPTCRCNDRLSAGECHDDAPKRPENVKSKKKVENMNEWRNLVQFTKAKSTSGCQAAKYIFQITCVCVFAHTYKERRLKAFATRLTAASGHNELVTKVEVGIDTLSYVHMCVCVCVYVDLCTLVSALLMCLQC